ncbi:MAG: hypothetical protein PWQ37_2656, partial [Candidatus Petromonas sp.]|nr:hypothetical protein [Candidatus Petromonas sp.]
MVDFLPALKDSLRQVIVGKFFVFLVACFYHGSHLFHGPLDNEPLT